MKYLEELLMTPDILRRVVSEKPSVSLSECGHVVLCGCGTSYYIAGLVAGLCSAQGISASAAEAVDIIEGGVPAGAPGTVYVFISRSGSSMETLMAQRAAGAAGYATVYLGCTAGSPLDAACDSSEIIPYANETLVLESYSYYAQLVRLAQCFGLPLPADLPDIAARGLSHARETYREHIAGKPIRRMISLGSPFYMPLLREMMLKNGEITQISSEQWGILEFRHGPRSWADEKCLISVIPGAVTYEFDKKAAAELVSYGCHVIWYSRDALNGAARVDTGQPKYSVAESVWLAAFMTGLAAYLGEEVGADAASLRHVVHNVAQL